MASREPCTTSARPTSRFTCEPCPRSVLATSPYLDPTANLPNSALTASFTGLATPNNASIVHATTGQRLGTFAAYASGHTDGTQIPKGVLQFDCATDASGNITLGTAATGGPYQQTMICTPMYISGAFLTNELTGLDANAVTVWPARLIEGTLANGGIVELPD